MVEYFVVATSVYKNLFVAGGLPPEKIVIKPHFIHPDPGARSAAERGKYALFIGRLDQVKGIPTLLAAWKGLSDIPLFIRGNGSLENDVQRSIRDEQLRGSIQRLERMARPELMDKIKGARFLLWPSEGYYETFGFVAVESFSCGVPVIASRIGVLAEIVRENVTGLLFTPGDPADLAAKVRWAWDHPAEMDAMGKNARREYEARYTAKENYPKLMEIYRQAIENYH
jgi:glycosyltransferase involved in cell wall biosynthesis